MSQRTLRPRLLWTAAAILLCLLSVREARALDLCYSGGAVTGVTLNGGAVDSGQAITVTRDQVAQAGSAFASTRFSSAGDLRAFLNLDISTSSGHGADGMAFVMHAAPAADKALGLVGIGMGYAGLSPSVVVEFDTYQNAADPDDNHVALMYDGDYATHVATFTPQFTLRRSRFNVWIDYTAAATRLDVYVSQGAQKPLTPALTQTVNLAARLGASFYAGFTASTGVQSSLHSVRAFVMTDGSLTDTDGDGVVDQCDADADNDCVPDTIDPDPRSPQLPAGPHCSGTTPLCRVVDASPYIGACQSCNGDQGTAATAACPDVGAPYCRADGACGACASDSDCVGHAGPYCHTSSGACAQSPPAPASVTAISGSSQSAAFAAAFGAPLGVVVRDAAGAPFPGASVTFTGSTSGAGCQLSEQVVKTDAAGQAQVTATAGVVPGRYQVTASVPGVLKAAIFELANVAGPPASVASVSGGGQQGPLGAQYPLPLVASVTDSTGSPLGGVTVRFYCPPTGARCKLSSSTATTNEAGEASVHATPIDEAGSFQVTAHVDGADSIGYFDLVGSTPNAAQGCACHLGHRPPPVGGAAALIAGLVPVVLRLRRRRGRTP